jgi:hypothetical protein
LGHMHILVSNKKRIFFFCERPVLILDKESTEMVLVSRCVKWMMSFSNYIIIP